jgi:hypothetical protein
MNIPAGVVMRGLVIGPQWIGTAMPAWDTFAQMWNWFPNGAPNTSQGTPTGYGGFNTWWKPSLAAAATIGNCVRIIGDPNLVINGLAQATYLGYWRQVLDYCQSLGLYVYATNIGFERWGWPPGSSTTVLTNLHSAWGALLGQYSNVIGVDISNEACWSTSSALDNTATGNPTGNANSQTYTNMLIACANAVRGSCNLPVTYSASITAQGQVTWDWYGAGWFPHSMQLLTDADFMDFHLYADPMVTPAQLALYHTGGSIYSYSAGKQQFHGEFGVTMAKSSADRTALVSAVAQAVSTNTFDCGALWWQEYDFNQSTPTYEVGMWPGFGQPIRTDVSVPFATIPTTR